jgi:FemAB-related protein (PEP-CTERM system-associated)
MTGDAFKERGITVEISDGSGWDQYVMGHPRSSFYHLYGWGLAMEEVFGLKRYYLAARRNSSICGILPLVLVNAPPARKLVSVPIGVYAGPIADEHDTVDILVKEAGALTRNLGCDYLELRNMDKVDPALPSKELYVTFIKPLPLNKEECLERMPRKARAEARRASEKGLTYETGPGHLDVCYELYAINQRALGSPVVSKRWFKALERIFKDKTDVLVVKLKGRSIAAVLTLFHKDTVLPFYGAALAAYARYSPSNYMYLKLQEYGVEKGYRLFDFGRSRKDAGSYRFKAHQGFEPAQLYYQYYLNKAKEVPDISPSNKGFDAARNVWRHLPLSVTKFLGPELYKYVMP